MPIVRRATPMFARPPINYRRRGRRLGMGDCVLGQPSTDPACFTTDAYIRALNLAQDTAEQKANLLPAGNDAACYDQYMNPGPNFNPDAYNKCIGAQDVVSGAFVATARATPFASNPYQSVVAVDRTLPPPAPPVTVPKPPAQSNAPAPVVVGGGSAQSNAPAPVVAGGALAQLKTLVTGTAVDSIPNWVLGVGAVGLAWAVFGRKGR